MNEDGFPRRALLIAATGLASGCAILKGGASHPEYAPAAVGETTAKIPLSELKKLSSGEALLVKLPSPKPEILVAALEDGTYRAAGAECTHWGCTVDWEHAKKEWQCPCHGSRFAADGAVLEGPAEDPLPILETRVEGEELVIDYSKI